MAPRSRFASSNIFAGLDEGDGEGSGEGGLPEADQASAEDAAQTTETAPDGHSSLAAVGATADASAKRASAPPPPVMKASQQSRAWRSRRVLAIAAESGPLEASFLGEEREREARLILQRERYQPTGGGSGREPDLNRRDRAAQLAAVPAAVAGSSSIDEPDATLDALQWQYDFDKVLKFEEWSVGNIVHAPMHEPSLKPERHQGAEAGNQNFYLHPVWGWIYTKWRYFVVIAVYKLNVVLLPLYTFRGRGIGTHNAKQEYVLATDMKVAQSRREQGMEELPNPCPYDPVYMVSSRASFQFAETGFIRLAYPTARSCKTPSKLTGYVHRDSLGHLMKLFHRIGPNYPMSRHETITHDCDCGENIAERVKDSEFHDDGLGRRWGQRSPLLGRNQDPFSGGSRSGGHEGGAGPGQSQNDNRTSADQPGKGSGQGQSLHDNSNDQPLTDELEGWNSTLEDADDTWHYPKGTEIEMAKEWQKEYLSDLGTSYPKKPPGTTSNEETEERDTDSVDSDRTLDIDSGNIPYGLVMYDLWRKKKEWWLLPPFGLASQNLAPGEFENIMASPRGWFKYIGNGNYIANPAKLKDWPGCFADSLHHDWQPIDWGAPAEVNGNTPHKSNGHQPYLNGASNGVSYFSHALDIDSPKSLGKISTNKLAKGVTNHHMLAGWDQRCSGLHERAASDLQALSIYKASPNEANKQQARHEALAFLKELCNVTGFIADNAGTLDSLAGQGTATLSAINGVRA